ncbi:hypothetical protein TpMuguga_01g01118 [Theileria parva strain Muguga]|uniref:Uncharacterized protein n=1 Tax=Theileria parva TaxID=5875 RepID=Q4N6Q2_THEPA|nr:uncharacterized protein TpMuguga_01g01118 [Theileria parva strain Muguga]EAN34356.1 hypothetical protein TpMuguga_01g01118 [Theileria parva strain Muguga]|eukprot:XP_766639.1 hypothetical protein [Theileria parva strain Muguga]
MEDTVKYNYLKSLGRRNQYFNNVSDIIAKTIKNELRIYEKDNVPLSDNASETDSEDNSDESSDASEELGKTSKNPYSYILDQFKDIISSEKCSNIEDSSNENKTTVHIKYSEPDHAHTDEPLGLDQNFKLGSKSEKVPEDAYNELDLNFLVKSGANEDSTINSYLPHIVLRKLNSNKDPLQLNKVFSNLERNLSDVRMKYRKTLSNLSLKSSAVRRNYRLSCFNTVDPKNINKVEEKHEHNHDTIINKPGVDRINFDLNKWLDELPDDLKNFIEVESITTSLNSIKDFKENKPPKDNKIYKMDLNSTDDKGIRENASQKEQKSVNEIKKEDKKPVPEKGYIEVIHEDYIEPLKHVLSEDFKSGFDGIKQGISDLYNNSPSIFQNLFGSSDPDNDREISKQLSKQLNSYYDDTDRNTGENGPETHDDFNDEFDKDYKYFDMNDKYQSFDISDEKPKSSTPVVNKDYNQNYVVYRENYRAKTPEKVIKSVADYNIGFLSNLWTINENCKLVRNENIRSGTKTINPWFGSPAKEALYRQLTLENSNEDKECTTILDMERGIKYKVVTDKNGQPEYLIDNIEPGDEETAKTFKNTVSTVQKNKYRNKNNSSDPKIEEGFFDPMLKHQEKIEQTKLINETDLAIFGRRKVTRTNR